MPTFKFKAKNKYGYTLRGEYDAADETQLYNMLEKNGLRLVGVEEEEYREPLFLKSVSAKELQIVCKQFFYLARASFNIREAVDNVRITLENKRVRGALIEVGRRMDGGASLADAFAAIPSVFSGLFVAMVRIGEKTGDLTFAFGKLEDYYRWLWELRRRTVKTLRYPIITLLFTSGIVFAAPIQLYYILVENTLAVPPDVMARLPISPLVFAYWPLIVGAPFILYYMLRCMHRASDRFADAMDSLLLFFPLVGGVIIKTEMSRYMLFLSMQYEAGIPIDEALHNASKIVKNRALGESLAAMADYVSRGNKPSEAAQKTAHVPQQFVHALKSGETTGFFDKPLMQLHQFYVSQVNHTLEATIEYLRYGLMILAGGILAYFGAIKPAADMMPIINRAL